MKVLVNFERNEKRERKHVQTHLGRSTKALANNQIYKTKFQRKKTKFASQNSNWSRPVWPDQL